MATGVHRILAMFLLGAAAHATLSQPSLLDAPQPARAATNGATESGARDIYGRSATSLSLDDLGINPALRFEFAQSAIRPIDPGIEADGLSATQRAELGLVDDTERIYDTGLRFDAARLGDLHLVMRGGVRTVTGGPQSDLANPGRSGDLRWAPVAGAGVEWRPHRDFWIGGSTLMNVDERGSTLAEITAELGLEVARGVSFSLGYRTLESQYGAPSDAAEDLRDAAFAAIRLRF